MGLCRNHFRKQKTAAILRLNSEHDNYLVYEQPVRVSCALGHSQFIHIVQSIKGVGKGGFGGSNPPIGLATLVPL